MKRADPRQQNFIVKLTYNWIPVHGRLYRQGYTATKQCMSYGVEEEDYVHLFRCQRQWQWRADFEIALEAHLMKGGTSADLRTVIVTNVRRWLNGGTQVTSCQDEVGTWHEFIKGYICRSWSEQQEGFYREHEKDPIQDTGKLWTAALIGFLLRINSNIVQRNCVYHPGYVQT
jgi:hypothetical protein